MQTKRAGMSFITPYLYVLPCILLLGVFVYIPLVANFYYSTLSFSAFSPEKTFVGLQNYKEMFADPIIRTALVNNVWYCVISVIFQVGLSLGIAAVLEDKVLRRVSTLLRTMYFLPVLISMTVVALLFSFVYHPKIGLINAGLELIGLDSLTHAWTGLHRYRHLRGHRHEPVALHGLHHDALHRRHPGIPTDLYEAAEIDGAGRLRRFIHVTLPQVREMAFVMMVTTVTGAFMVFNDVYILTGGGPGNSSTTLAVYMYKNGFALDKMGYASTLSVLMLIICMILALIQNSAFRSGKGD